MNFKVLIAAAALLASQSFAIIGIGAHYSPSFGSKLDAASTPQKVAENLKFSHEGFDGTMQGFGFKLWVDLLPIIDIEGTLNFQFGSYDASLWVKDPTNGTYQELPLEIEIGGTPFGKANPKFVTMTGDISITYPFTMLPIIRPYIGGGLSIHANSFVLNQGFVSALVDDPEIAGLIQEIAGLQNTEGLDAEAIQAKMLELQPKVNGLGDTMKQRVQDQALKEGLKTSVGGHILVGARFKLPIIPIAIYSNFKYYIGGDYPEEFSSGNMAVELGGGLAI
ncbi:MAG: hypothetical protein K6E57_02695 [Fibrobacter sp.]|jgi:hypothetical protein|uniref:hypothetical protein n=1 Tax=Fibrobacter sp. UWP2 TaxID=1896216 RepID=UPI000923082B|nr:hypothetical protein [Fibrobacter sp. UWP2]MBO7383816.1 hypothetical protein [Fibrobacter sp.]MCR5377856.1 hypothetical protein [Fibrobacter sp.]SHJ17710.1 hypothetical protein SAMN05720471_11961 [Fibrobacter sp. UWP2]